MLNNNRLLQGTQNRWLFFSSTIHKEHMVFYNWFSSFVWCLCLSLTVTGWPFHCIVHQRLWHFIYPIKNKLNVTFIPGKSFNISSTLMPWVIYEGLEGNVTENLFFFFTEVCKTNSPCSPPTQPQLSTIEHTPALYWCFHYIDLTSCMATLEPNILAVLSWLLTQEI